MDTVNIRIKITGIDLEDNPIPATDWAFIRDEKEFPPLAPGEIVTLAADEAALLVKKMHPYLEVTLEKSNRDSPRGLNEPLLEPLEPPVGKINTIAEAIKALDTDDETHFTGMGIPRVGALKDSLDFFITSEERDEAWATVHDG